MKMLVFSVRDSAAEYYQEPVFARTRAEIIRSLQNALGDPKAPFSQHAEHFALFEVGTFDTDTGMLVAHNAPVLVVGVWDLK